VRSKHFENKVRRAWWSVHIEAWQKSGLAQQTYCRQQRLDRKTFSRWLNVLTDAETIREQQKIARDAKRRNRRSPLSTDKRNRAVQAFWAMHVEAMNWSGLSVREYAAAHRISRNSLGRWRDIIADGEVEIDWRSMLHPSALPKISTSVSAGAKETGVRSGLTDDAAADRKPDGRSNRRTFSAEEKLAIVLECERPGATVSSVARDHDLATSALFRWRAQLGYGKEKPARLATVVVTGTGRKRSAEALVLNDLLPIPDGMTAVELRDGRRVFAPADVDPEAVRLHVENREAAP